MKTRIIDDYGKIEKSKRVVRDAISLVDRTESVVAVGLEDLGPGDDLPIAIGIDDTADGHTAWTFISLAASRAIREALKRAEERAS